VSQFSRFIEQPFNFDSIGRRNETPSSSEFTLSIKFPLGSKRYLEMIESGTTTFVDMY